MCGVALAAPGAVLLANAGRPHGLLLVLVGLAVEFCGATLVLAGIRAKDGTEAQQPEVLASLVWRGPRRHTPVA